MLPADCGGHHIPQVLELLCTGPARPVTPAPPPPPPSPGDLRPGGLSVMKVKQEASWGRHLLVLLLLRGIPFPGRPDVQTARLWYTQIMKQM